MVVLQVAWPNSCWPISIWKMVQLATKSVTVEVVKKYQSVEKIKVSDNGVGIPPKHMSQIFDPFFTTKKIGEGTGIGLNIVYRIVAKHEETIEVESAEGAGTTFTIKFPKWRDE